MGNVKETIDIKLSLSMHYQLHHLARQSPRWLISDAALLNLPWSNGVPTMIMDTGIQSAACK